MTTALQRNSSTKKTDWVALGWAYVYFFYFSGVVHLLVISSGIRNFVSLRRAVLASALWLIPILLFPRQNRKISAVLGAVLWLFSLVSLGYFCIYGQEFSQGVMFVIFESNAAETGEYLSQYFKWWMFPVVLAYSLVAFQLWRRMRPIDIGPWVARAVSAVIFITLFIYPNSRQLCNLQFSPSVAAEVLETRFEAAVPWQLIFGYKQYRNQLSKVQEMLGQYSRTPPLQNLKDANSGVPSTLVLVIGESTNRQHMGLYGYARPTTPRLSARGSDLLVFKNVVSSAAYTIGALRPALTFAASAKESSPPPDLSIIGMMKQAGYKTFWITNQLTVARNNTMLTSFSQQADQKIYLNNGKTRDAQEFDGKVLEPFKRILGEAGDRKFVVVHLLGTHTKYEYRYPQEYRVFANREGLPEWVTHEQMQVINSYDNAVLYNDFVVASLIEAMETTRINGLLVYFSDHGEDVFDSSTHDILGHNEEKSTPPMYTVPFILWQSRQWKIMHPQDSAPRLDQAYVTSGFLHTWAYLAGLRFDGFDPCKSLVGRILEDCPLSSIDHIKIHPDSSVELNEVAVTP